MAASASPSVSPSTSVSPSLSISPSQSPSVSVSPSPSPSVSPSVSISPSKSPSISPSVSPSKSPSVSPSVSVSPSASPSLSLSYSQPAAPAAKGALLGGLSIFAPSINGDTMNGNLYFAKGYGVVTAAGVGATNNSDAVTLNHRAGMVTTVPKSTAKDATFSITVTSSAITAHSVVVASVNFGTCTTGNPVVSTVAPAAGSVVITILNSAPTDSFNGTLKVSYIVF